MNVKNCRTCPSRQELQPLARLGQLLEAFGQLSLLGLRGRLEEKEDAGHGVLHVGVKLRIQALTVPEPMAFWGS